MHNTTGSSKHMASNWGMLDNQAQQLLSPQEQETMSYYLKQYEAAYIDVKQCVMALMQLLNTHAKVRWCTIW